MRPIVLTCGGEAIATLVAVDRRVLVLSLDAGRGYLIVEKPLSSVQVTRMQKILTGRKMYDGAADGILDAATRRTVGRFAKACGADKVFERAAVTENFFGGLGVMELKKRGTVSAVDAHLVTRAGSVRHPADRAGCDLGDSAIRDCLISVIAAGAPVSSLLWPG